MISLILIVALFLGVVRFRMKAVLNPVLIPFVFLFFVAAIRFDYGNDYNSYLEYYNYVNYVQGNVKREILFYFINKIIPSFSLLLALLSGIYIFAVYKLISSVTNKYRFISLYVFVVNPYLFLMSLSAVRQTLALSLFIFALLFIFTHEGIIKECLVYTSLLICAAMIHQSAMLLLPFFLLITKSSVSKTNRYLDCFIFILLPIFILTNSWFEYIVKYIIESLNNENYILYINNNTENSLRMLLLTLVIYIYVVIGLFKLDGVKYSIVRLYAFGLFIGLLSFRIAMMTRIQMYFDIFGVVALPLIWEVNLSLRCKNRLVYTMYNVLWPIVILAIFFARYISFMTNDLWQPFFEYKTLFF